MYIVFLASSERSLKLDTREYLPKLEDLASKATLYYNIAAFNILICAFRTFKYFRLNNRMSILWDALRGAGRDIASFLLMFFIMLIGFLLFGLISFGTDVEAFNSFANSWGSCWNFVLGNPPDYIGLSKSNRVLAPLFFMMFTIFIFFIMINMFIAILSDSLSDIRTSRKSLPRKKRLSRGVFKSVQLMLQDTKKRIKGEPVVSLRDLIEKMKDKDIFDRERVTIDDIKDAVGGCTDEQAEILFDIHQEIHPSSEKDIIDNLVSSVVGATGFSLTKSQAENINTKDEVARLTEEVASLHDKLDRLTDLLAKKNL
jgi:hypothetical protein